MTTTDGPGAETVSRKQVEAVCSSILSSFPNVIADPPRVPERYFYADSDVALIRSRRYSIRISEECFQYHKPSQIAAALVALGYPRLLREHRHILLGCVSERARSDLPNLARSGEWYLLGWSSK